MISKSDVISMVAEKANMTTAESQRSIDAFLETIKENVKKDEKVQLQDFGSFVLKVYKAHTGRNPRTGESIEVPEKNSINFKPSGTLKNYLNGEEKK